MVGSLVLAVRLGNKSGFWGAVSEAGFLAITALPVTMGVAILKYRLYDIDRIISRTLAYAIVTGLLVGVYAGLVLLITQVFRFHTPVAVAPPRWRRWRCSRRCAAACSGWWTGASTAPAITPTRPWPHSRPG